MNHTQIKDYTDWVDSFPKDWVRERRCEYLEGEIKSLEEYLSDFYQEYEKRSPESRVFSYKVREIPKHEKQLSRLKKELAGHGKADNGITDEMIERARDYPMEDLAGGVGMLKCVFHEDKSPSMLVKNGFAFCFSCNKSWDTIAWVMETEGLKFADAVRRLL